tara:strand:+ start:251 stop:427 length:177 start_codon:yes stop_codon:yes gene_type:complete
MSNYRNQDSHIKDMELQWIEKRNRLILEQYRNLQHLIDQALADFNELYKRIADLEKKK